METHKARAFKKVLFLFPALLIIGIWLVLKFGNREAEPHQNSKSYDQVDVSAESCMQCHTQVKGFSQFHDPKLIGCVVCHLGDPTKKEKIYAHKGMVLIPGNLSNAARTCGTCHVNELDRVEHSLMTTNSGLVAVDKFVFGESDSPDQFFDIRELGHGVADEHLRDLCANCHLGAEKTALGPINELSRGGGCNACHLNYSEGARLDLEAYFDSNRDSLPKIHPSTDINVTDEHCFGCHSRSSRISTNYMGWHETLLDEHEVKENDSLRVFDDKRVYQYIGDDVHHSKGMMCIDCHSSHEVMGDGRDHMHEEEAVTLSCSDCHVREAPNTVAFQDLDQESQLVFMHRNYQHTNNEIVIAAEDGHPLVNTFVDDGGQVVLLGKKDGKTHYAKRQSTVCSRDAAHGSMSCASCHTTWAPRCIGCHNSYDPIASGYDLLDKKMIRGTWMEHVFEFDHSLPTLGVRVEGNDKSIEPAIPGMILTIDRSKHPDAKEQNISFHRLYAPNAPHTTSKDVRTCGSCHSNPNALGYGKGTLAFVVREKTGRWYFEPDYATNPTDNLPEDAWIPFLKETAGAVHSTRSDFRPFNILEQKNILTVGACLQCHQPTSKIMRSALKNGINPLLLKISDQCVVPEF